MSKRAVRPSAEALRQRRARARRRAGEPSLIDVLIETGRLGEWDERDKKAIGRAVSLLLSDWASVTWRDAADPLRRATDQTKPG